jgi:tetratricopeptide (TPR) repeat protein
VRSWDLDPLHQGGSLRVQPLITLLGLRRWPEAIEQTEILLRRFPDEASYYLWRAKIQSFAQLDAEPMRAALRDHGNECDAKERAVTGFEVAIAEGRYLDAIRLQEIGWSYFPPVYRETYAGVLYYIAGDERRARNSLRAAERHALQDSDAREELAISQSVLGEHAAALATIDAARARTPESRDAINGPEISFVRSVVLLRAGRSEEAYAEVNRLLRVPFGNPLWKFGGLNCVALLVKDDTHFDELLHRPPRL